MKTELPRPYRLPDDPWTRARIFINAYAAQAGYPIRDFFDLPSKMNRLGPKPNAVHLLVLSPDEESRIYWIRGLNERLSPRDLEVTMHTPGTTEPEEDIVNFLAHNQNRGHVLLFTARYRGMQDDEKLTAMANTILARDGLIMVINSLESRTGFFRWMNNRPETLRTIIQRCQCGTFALDAGETFADHLSVAYDRTTEPHLPDGDSPFKCVFEDHIRN